jgi:peptidoglycan/LPS O-acetylase OafA/YrhL
MESPQGNRRNQWLDVVRALAICLVLLSHGRVFLLPLWDGFNVLKFGGFLGVELFFVLSGYLIGGIILDAIDAAKSPFTWIWEFWFRRFLRTIPNYVLFLAINLVLIESGIRLADSPDIIRYASFTQNLAWQHPPFFPEAWSLATEEIFYFVTPLLIALVLLTGSTNKKAIGIVAILVFLFSFLMRALAVILENPTWDEGMRKITLFRLDALMMGVFLVMWGRSSLSMYLTRRVSIALCLLLIPSLYFAVQPNSYLDQSQFARILLFPMASLGCAGLITVGLVVTVNGIARQTFEALARWSYAIYLVHLPVLSMLLFALPPDAVAGVVLGLAWISFIGITLVISSLFYRYYESFFLRLRERFV